MILNYLKKITFVCGIILLSLSISGNSVFAAKGGKTQIPQLVIVEVYVDFTNETITINGDNFSNGDTPVITLGTQNLNVNSYSDTEIITELPIGIIDGDYLMTVITGPSSQNFDSYNLTVRVIEPNDQLIALCLLYQGLS